MYERERERVERINKRDCEKEMCDNVWVNERGMREIRRGKNNMRGVREIRDGESVKKNKRGIIGKKRVGMFGCIREG